MSFRIQLIIEQWIGRDHVGRLRAVRGDCEERPPQKLWWGRPMAASLQYFAEILYIRGLKHAAAGRMRPARAFCAARDAFWDFQ